MNDATNNPNPSKKRDQTEDKTHAGKPNPETTHPGNQQQPTKPAPKRNPGPQAQNNKQEGIRSNPDAAD